MSENDGTERSGAMQLIGGAVHLDAHVQVNRQMKLLVAKFTRGVVERQDEMELLQGMKGGS